MKKRKASKGNGKECRGGGGGGVGSLFTFVSPQFRARPKAIWNGNPQTLRSPLTDYYNQIRHGIHGKQVFFFFISVNLNSFNI